MAVPAEDIKTVEDARLWAVDHDARIDVWWKQQFRWNAAKDDADDVRDARIRALELKIVYWTGGASMLGATIGVVTTWVIGRLLGGA